VAYAYPLTVPLGRVAGARRLTSQLPGDSRRPAVRLLSLRRVQFPVRFLAVPVPLTSWFPSTGTGYRRRPNPDTPALARAFRWCAFKPPLRPGQACNLCRRGLPVPAAQGASTRLARHNEKVVSTEGFSAEDGGHVGFDHESDGGGSTVTKVDKLVTQAQAHLEPGEEVLAAVAGAYETKRLGQESVRNGSLIATDRRLLFFAKKLGGYELESFPYHNISSFEQAKALVMGHSVNFFASGNNVTVKWIKDAQALGELVGVVKARMGSKAETPVGTEPDVMDQLRKLGELRDAGVLSTDEFESKKAKLLDQI
jgi:hypothetical protein